MFCFLKNIVQNIGGQYFWKNILQNIASLSKKCDIFTQCFRFQKAHSETEIDKHGKLSVENYIKETSQLEMCLFVLIQLGLGRRMLCMITLSCECFNTLVTIVRSYLCVCQRVRVEISNSSANVVALVEFVSLLLLMQVCMQVKEWLHLCAFSPVCVILCFCNLCACA